MTDKIKLGRLPYIYPIPIVLAGVNVQGRANFATVGDCGLMGINPPLVFISLHRNHYSTAGVEQNQTFSINIPPASLLTLTDYCGIVSGREVDKSVLFDVFYGETGSAPMIAECRVCLECTVVNQFSIKHRCIFVGEVVQTYADPSCVVEKDGQRMIAGMQTLDPILYALDNGYYRVGGRIGTGYEEGRKFRPD